jgi:glycosyltransferase involved in cell wall biosynthesis
VLEAVARAALGYEVVVVDDGSSDGTAAVARRLGAGVISHPFNLGYGAALQTGYKAALELGAPLVVQMDADGQHDPALIPRLVAPIERDEADLVLGSRFLEPGGYRMGWFQTLGRLLFRLLARLFALEVTDPTSGFQAMNRAVLEMYAEDFYPSDYPDVDVLLDAHRHGLRVREVAVTMSAGARASTLHGGLRDLSYAYRMLLSVWAATARRTSSRPTGRTEVP